MTEKKLLLGAVLLMEIMAVAGMLVMPPANVVPFACGYGVGAITGLFAMLADRKRDQK